MQKIYLSQIPDGTPIAYDLYNDKGIILLKKGTKMSPALREKLHRNNIIFLIPQISPFETLDDRIKYLDEPVIEEIENIKKLYKETFYQISREFETFKDYSKLDKKNISDITQSLVTSISNNQQVYTSIQGIRRKDAYTYLHSIDVSILMILFGKSMGLDPNQIEEAATAGLLHDIGKTKIQDSILLKPEKLTVAEGEIMKKHTIYGYNILKDQLGYKEAIARVAREHHERMDGQGYPRGIKWENMHMFSKMATICDIYDAITSERVYKKAMLPHIAIEYLMSIVNSHLDPQLVRQFIYNIAIYPMGTKVLLNTGEEGIVIKNNKNFPLRPVVQIIDGKTRRNLLAELTIFIKEVIE